jgi:phosphatidylinositol kinase/protein kinase (PI-3  family)
LIDWNHESKSICGNKDNEKSGTKGGEHENTYAIGVFKRIQERLGDDMTRQEQNNTAVETQVSNLIRHATSKTYLSRMYEGWAPWV